MTNEPLVAAARKAAESAYCPYSKFPVGAALLAEDGRVFAGCNVENASYGLTLCAERSAFAAALAAGSRRFQAMAVVSDGETPAAPCGACRQVMREFCGPDFRVILAARVPPGPVRTVTLAELLPLPFPPDSPCA